MTTASQDLVTRGDGELFENAFRHAPIGMALVSLEGRFLRVNDAFCAIVDFTPEEMLASDFQTITHPDDLDADLHLLAELTEGRRPHYQMEKRYLRKDGGIVFANLSVSMVTDDRGRPVNYISQVQDVTARIVQEQALAAAMATAEAATRAKSEFLANMSHEIRTPLTAVLGFTDLLHGRTDLDQVARGHVERVHSAGKALLSIVNDILDFSKLEAGRYEMAVQAVSPVEVARDALLMFTPQAAAKGLALEFVETGALPAFVSTDPDRLRQILLNLIGNAVKFTDAGKVTLTIGHDGRRLGVAVADTGMGLSESQQAGLFERFSQVGSGAAGQGGTGLGLAICRGLVEAMGGTISVRSAAGSGSTFRFDIMAAAADAPAPEATVEDTGDLSALRVLVVDDNISNRELVRIMLESAGIEVSEAVDGEAGVEQAASARFDVILMDIRMPLMTGDQALRAIRSMAGPNRDTPILAFSAEADVARWDTEGFPFDGFVRKPLVVAELMTALMAAVTPDPQGLQAVA